MFNQYQDTLQGQAFALENQIAALQSELTQLQAHQQAIGSVEQACESAIDQLRTALAMVQRIAPELAVEFREEAIAVFQDRPALESHEPEPEPVEPPSTEPEDPTTVELEAVEDIETPQPEDNYETMDFESLKEEARRRKLSLRGRRTPDQVRKALRGLPVPRAA